MYTYCIGIRFSAVDTQFTAVRYYWLKSISVRLNYNYYMTIEFSINFNRLSGSVLGI